MKKLFAILSLITFTALQAGAQSADSATKSVVLLTSESKNHTTLGTALKSAGLDKTLETDGPFTIFAPTDAAFNKISKDSLTTIMQTGKEKELKNMLNYIVITGSMDLYLLAQTIKDDEDGKLELQTVNGGIITASMEKDKIKLTDERGTIAYVDPKVEMKASNGVVLSIDTVLMPK